MKQLIAAVALTLCGTALAADPVVGTWKTETGETGGYLHVDITTCGASICGKIAKVLGSDNTSIEGERIIWDMQAKGNGNYSGGRIWAPDVDKTYRSKMALNGNALKVSGCVGPICRGQTWTRIGTGS